MEGEERRRQDVDVEGWDRTNKSTWGSFHTLHRLYVPYRLLWLYLYVSYFIECEFKFILYVFTHNISGAFIMKVKFEGTWPRNRIIWGFCL